MLLIPCAFALSLEDAWRSAEEKGQESQLLTESRKQSELFQLQAWAALSPKITLTGNWTLNQRETALDFSKMFPPDMLDLIETFTGKPVDLGDPVVINQKHYVDWNLTLLQPIFNAQAFPGIAGARAMGEAGKAQEAAGRAQLRLGIARAWWGVTVARQGVAVATEALALSQKHVELAEHLVAVGSATRPVLLQAQMAKARAERDLVGAQARQVQAESTLAALIELPPETTLDPAIPHSLPYQSVEEALERALQQRPELLAADAQQKAAKMQASASTLSWLPSINARFTEAYSENTGFSGENYNWMLVGTASWTLWDGGFRLSDNLKTSSMAHQAQESLEKTRQDTEIAVRSAWEDRVRAHAALQAVNQELALAQENLRLVEASVQAGVSPWIDAEDARMALNAAQMSQINEQMNLDLATLTLLAATGDL